MQRLWPTPGEINDIAALVADEARPPWAARPWLLVNMITSLDGAIAIEGRSGGLGGPADAAVFAALRGIADVILVGAGTARTERYGPPRPSAATRRARQARGQAPAPRIAVVTRSLTLDLASPLFTEAEERPLVIAPAAADPARLAEVAAVAELVLTGGAEVDLTAALAQLRRGGVAVVTAEGGPILNANLAAADLIDEWALSVAPRLVGGDAARAVTGAPPVDHRYRLERLLEGDDILLSRWVRQR